MFIYIVTKHLSYLGPTDNLKSGVFFIYLFIYLSFSILFCFCFVFVFDFNFL